MRKIIPSLKQQGVLFGEHYIDDKLKPDDLVYVFDRLLGELDLSSITQAYSQEGGAMYCPREKLSVLLFAYLNSETTSIALQCGGLRPAASRAPQRGAGIAALPDDGVVA